MQDAFKPGTFFGMHQSVAAATFSLKEARDATEWEDLLKVSAAHSDALSLDPLMPPPLPKAGPDRPLRDARALAADAYAGRHAGICSFPQSYSNVGYAFTAG